MTLETEHLLLEPVNPAHAEGLHAATVASQAELVPWMPWAREPALAETVVLTQRAPREWIEDHAFHFSLVERETGEVLGVAGLNRESQDTAELHYWIRSDHAGRGWMTEACRRLIDWACEALRLRTLTLWAGRDNHASRRVAEKLGFTHLGPLSRRPQGGLGDFAAERYELRLDRQEGGASRG